MKIRFDKFDYREDLARQRELFIECFPENINTSVVTIDHYHWKFHTGPFSPPSFEYIARDESDELIGYYAALPYPYTINGKLTSVGMVCDVMTGIKARGKGVFTKLGQYATDDLKNEGIPFTTAYPIRKYSIPGHINIGWKIMFDLPMYIKLIQVKGIAVHRYLKAILQFCNYPLKWLNNIIYYSRPKYTSRIFHQSELNKIDEYKEFLFEWSKGKMNFLNKSIEFLQWRLGAPSKNYEILAVYLENKIAGIAITTKTMNKGIPALAVIDIMIPDHFLFTASFLHKEILNLAIKKEVDVIIIMASKFWAKKYKFLSNLYFRSPFTFKLIIKKLSGDVESTALDAPQNWHLMWIDSDDL